MKAVSKATSFWNISAAKASICMALAFAALTACLPAQAADVSGGSTAQAASGLYSAGLYLEQPTHASQDLLGNTGGKRLRLVVLRDTSSRQISAMLSQGLVDNSSNDALADLLSEIFEVGVLLSEHGVFHPGDTLQIDSHPATGTTVTIGSAGGALPSVQSFANPHLSAALMGVWLGEHPVDAGLKQALLASNI